MCRASIQVLIEMFEWHAILTKLTWTLLFLSKYGTISLNWFTISLCRAMSVARMHRIIPSLIFLNVSYEKFRKILHSGSSRIRNATEQWWFSSGDMSLYRRASSVCALICRITIHFINQWVQIKHATMSFARIAHEIIVWCLPWWLMWAWYYFECVPDRYYCSRDDPDHGKYKKLRVLKFPSLLPAQQGSLNTTFQTSVN